MKPVNTLVSLTIVAFVLCPFRLASAGDCEPASANSIGVPSFAQDGDLINYTYTCSIPVAPIPCDATLDGATFFKPDNPPNDVNQCDATNGLALPAPAVTLAPGEFIRFSAVDNPAIPNCGAGDVDCEIVDPNLQYIADHADEVAGELTAFGCCKFVALPGGEDTQAQAEDDTTVLHPNITIDKSAEPTSVCEGFETEVTYSYEVEWDLERDPPADTDVVDVMVTDDTCAPVVRGPDNPGNNNDTLELGELFTFSCTTTVSTETTNTATATAVEPNLERGVEASDDFTVTAEICDVSIDKICDANQTQFINEISIEVCNDGTVQLENCMVSDEYFPGDPECPGNGGPGTGVALDCPAELSTLDPGECQTCTGTIDPCVEMDTANNAEVTCEVVGTDDTVQDDDCDVCEPCCIPNIDIVKRAGGADDGVLLKLQRNEDLSFPAVTYHYDVCNTGTCDLSDVTVTDDNGTPGNPGDDFTITIGFLAAGDCVTVSSDPIDIPDPPFCVDGIHVNDACAVGTAPTGEMVEDCDPAEVCYNCMPDIEIIKTAGDAPDGGILEIEPGDEVIFHYEVCNTGTCDLINVTVTDDNATPDTGDDFTITIGFLAAGDCVTVDSDPMIIEDPPICGATRVNTACATGEAPDGAIVNDCDDAELCTPDELDCRVTGGGNLNQTDEGGNRFTWGGQAGAPTAEAPQPCGEWTHRQHNGPGGKWTFHAGTASAPPGTEIDSVACCDPGFCNPARPAPAKQITFDGVGTFKNLHIPPPPVPGFPEPEAGDTFHWFEVHIEDLGEPGSQHGGADSDQCPEGGFNCATGDCGCLDFYRFTLYAASCEPGPGCLNSVMYEVYGYMEGGGNHQIHPPIPGEHNCTGGGPDGGGPPDGSQTVDAGEPSEDSAEFETGPLPFVLPVEGCTAGLIGLMLAFVGLVGLRLRRD